MKILILNSGSSSQKTALFELEPAPSADPVPPLWEGTLQWDGDKDQVHIRNHKGEEIRRDGRNSERRASVAAMLEYIWSGPTAVLKSLSEIATVGHRIVHGGAKLTEPVRISPEVKQEIENVAAIAPLHNQAGLQGIELIEKLLPDVPQIAVFDTGFHRTLPPEAFIYPLPYSWYDRRGIRRYGFHGINHEYCTRRTAQLLRRDLSSFKIITCHLGNGCSLAAVDRGKSVDTTMGFTPLEGLMMGTRSGSVDPGILLNAMRGNPRDIEVRVEELDHILNHDSGLLGVSGISSDMRDILDAVRSGNKRAELAFNIFIHRLQAGIGALTASLGGLEALVFTAGIGENSPHVRRSTCKKLGFLGIELDHEKNSSATPDVDISQPAAKVRVLVIRAQEDWAIAQECARMISHG
jgi:acetate kinase